MTCLSSEGHSSTSGIQGEYADFGCINRVFPFDRRVKNEKEQTVCLTQTVCWTQTPRQLHASKTKVFCSQQRAEYIYLVWDDIHLAIHKYITNILYFFSHSHKNTIKPFHVHIAFWRTPSKQRNIPCPHRHSERLTIIFLQVILGQVCCLLDVTLENSKIVKMTHLGRDDPKRCYQIKIMTFV